MGFKGIPDNPPTLLLRMGIPVSTFIIIALIVFIAVMASAPDSWIIVASFKISVFPIPTLIITGFLVLDLIVLIILVTKSGSSPTSMPIFATCGQERLIS